jgi:hypothetical protein
MSLSVKGERSEVYIFCKQQAHITILIQRRDEIPLHSAMTPVIE